MDSYIKKYAFMNIVLGLLTGFFVTLSVIMGLVGVFLWLWVWIALLDIVQVAIGEIVRTMIIICAIPFGWMLGWMTFNSFRATILQPIIHAMDMVLDKNKI